MPVPGVIVMSVVFATLALLLGFSRWLAHRPLAAAGNLLVALVIAGAAVALGPPAVNLRTYEPMPVTGPVAQVSAERLGPDAYRVTLTRLPSGRMQVFDVQGDEWRLDARTLVWHGRAAQAGLGPSYRLDRLGSRFLLTETSNGATPPVPWSFTLANPDEPGTDIWEKARSSPSWERHASARHAYGPWRPLVHGSRFEVWLSRNGVAAPPALEVRAANDAAAKALQARTAAAPR